MPRLFVLQLVTYISQNAFLTAADDMYELIFSCTGFLCWWKVT